jgi:hypothetical protein
MKRDNRLGFQGDEGSVLVSGFMHSYLPYKKLGEDITHSVKAPELLFEPESGCHRWVDMGSADLSDSRECDRGSR